LKYLKTYKLFENKSEKLWLYSDEDLNKINDSVEELYIDYKIKNWPKLPKKLKFLYCSDNNITNLPTELSKSLLSIYCSDNKLKELPDITNTNIDEFFFYNNPLKYLPNGITKSMLDENNSENFINRKALKWIINKPEHYNLLKEYLSEEDKKELEEIHPEFSTQEQFGMFSK